MLYPHTGVYYTSPYFAHRNQLFIYMVRLLTVVMLMKSDVFRSCVHAVKWKWSCASDSWGSYKSTEAGESVVYLYLFITIAFGECFGALMLCWTIGRASGLHKHYSSSRQEFCWRPTGDFRL